MPAGRPAPLSSSCVEQLCTTGRPARSLLAGRPAPLKLQLRPATLHYWPAGALECIVQPVPKPCTIGRPAPLKLQLRRATLHYWLAGAPQCILQPVLNVPDRVTVVPKTRRPLRSGTGRVQTRPDLVTVPGLTDYKPLACPLLGNMYTHIYFYM